MLVLVLLLLTCTMQTSSEEQDVTSAEDITCHRHQGLIYAGSESHTISGASCMRWSKYDIADLPKNYCRNTNTSRHGVWCYTSTEGDWEYCSVPICNAPPYINEVYLGNLVKISSQKRSNYIIDNIVNKTKTDYNVDIAMLVLTPIILVAGTVCNSFSIAVFTRPSLRKSTTAFLLTVLAVCDTLSLHMGCWVQWLKALFRHLQIENFLDASSETSCKIYTYLYFTVQTLSVWVLVLFIFERVFGRIIQPKLKYTRYHTCMVLAAILLIILLVYIPLPLWYTNTGVVRIGQDDDVDIFAGCVSSSVSTWKIFFLLDSLIRILIPFLLMFAGNITIIISLHTSVSPESASHAEEVKSLAALLLTASFTHLILTIPALFFYFDSKLFAIMNLHTLQNFSVFWLVVTICTFLDQSVNFLLYCISTQRVRSEFLKMLGCKKLPPLPRLNSLNKSVKRVTRYHRPVTDTANWEEPEIQRTNGTNGTNGNNDTGGGGKPIYTRVASNTYESTDC